MGLDITAYQGLTKVKNPEFDSDGYPIYGLQWCEATIRFTENNFPGRTAGLEQDIVYECEDSFGFRAGSYGGYNEWRRLRKRSGLLGKPLNRPVLRTD
jgi:hypothetical protein